VSGRLSFDELRALLAEVLSAHGTADHVAPVIAARVAGAERDGTLSHGLVRMPGYVSTLRSGWVDGRATPAVHYAGPSSILADAGNGFSQMALKEAAPMLTARARETGIALLAIRNGHNFASLYADIEPLAEQGLVALSFANSRSHLVPAGGTRKLFGSNPMAFATPRGDGPPLVFDQASTVMSQGEVIVAAERGHAVPDGVGQDRDGRPTNDPHAILDGGALLPFGGHKGSSIALMIELLAAALTGATFGFEDESARYPGAKTSRAGQVVIAIDPARTAGDAFARRVEELLARVSSNGEARLPGQRRLAARAAAERDGIPVSREALERLERLRDEGWTLARGP
jgi:delta1-piperideine-2-carboxylate reductase